MEILRSTFLFTLATSLVAASFAETPKIPPVTVTENPGPDAATLGPERRAEEENAEPPADHPNPVADYTLAGLSKVADGWFVVLLHKRDRSQRIRLRPNEVSGSGFTVTAVENPEGREARVEIEVDGQKGWVQFEPKYLAVKKPTPKYPPPRLYRINIDDLPNYAKRVPPPPAVRKAPTPPPDEIER